MRHATNDPASTPLRSHARTLLRTTAAYGINALVGPLFTILLTPIYARILTPADYGVLEVVLTLGTALSVIAWLGQRTALAVSLKRQPDEQARRRAIASAIWMATSCALLLALLGAFTSAPIAQIWLHDAGLAPIVALALANLPASVLVTLLIDALRLRQEVWRASVLGVAQLVALAAGNILFVVLLRYGVRGALGAQLGANLVLAVLGACLAPNLMFARPGSAWLRPLLLAGLPLIPAGLATLALGVADRPLLLQMGVSTDQIGIYAVGNKLASMLAFLSVPFQAAWIPFALSISERPEAPRTFARVLTAFLALMLGGALALGLFAHEALIFVGTYRYLDAQGYVWLLAYSAVIQGSYVIVSTGLYLAEKTTHLAWTSVVGAAINIGLNLVLVPRLGVFGAAIATPLGYLCGPVGAYMVAQRLHPIPYDLRRVALILTTQVLLLAIGLPWSVETSFTSLALRVGLLLAYPCILVGLNIIQRHEVGLAWNWLGRTALLRPQRKAD